MRQDLQLGRGEVALLEEQGVVGLHVVRMSAERLLERFESWEAAEAGKALQGLGIAVRTVCACLLLSAGVLAQSWNWSILPAVPVANEQQGEAVSYRADGRGYYTTSEGASPPINRVLCR